MSDLITAKARSVRIVALGGTAINILRAYRENQPKVTDLLADEHYSYIDTSPSNLTNVSKDDTFLLPKTDGSGGDRAKNAKAFKDVLPEIMQTHSEGDVIIVIFSAAGGSGSAGAPQYIEEMLKKGKTVVAIIIGSHNSVKRTTNTIGTMTGLEGVVKRTGRPLVMFYKENDLTKSNSFNNMEPLFVIQTLSMLASGKNEGLDSADVKNLFDYHTVTHHLPGLAMLNVYADIDKLKEGTPKKVIGFAALLRDRDGVAPQIDTDYDTLGFLPATKTKDEEGPSFYYTVSNDKLSEIFDRLLEKRAEVAEHKTVSKTTTSLLSDKADADKDTGLVFE